MAYAHRNGEPGGGGGGARGLEASISGGATLINFLDGKGRGGRCPAKVNGAASEKTYMFLTSWICTWAVV